MPHCSEQAVLPNEGKYWSDVFKTLGVTLNVVNSGCCGMSGTYGHLAEHQLTSQAIFRQNWQQNAEATDVVVLASGFSCRAQTDKQIKQKLLHPIEIINQLVQERNYRE